MDWQKNLLLAAMGAVLIMLVMRWDDFQQRQAEADPSGPTTAQASQSATSAGDIPQAVESDSAVPSSPGANTSSAPPEPDATDALISVKTDTLELQISLHGGDIVRAALPRHYAEVDTPNQPFVLMSHTPGRIYNAQSGLVGPNGTDSEKGRPHFQAKAGDFTMTEGQDTLKVDLTFEQNGVDITKRFIFRRGTYQIQIKYLINNQTQAPWKASFYGQIKRDSHNPGDTAGIGMQPFLGAAITTEDERYKKFDFSDLQDESFKTSLKGGWVSMVQHYFISAWIPDPDKTNHYYLRQLGNRDLYLMGFTSALTTIAPGQQGSLSATFYAGPKDTSDLEKIAPYLDLTVDYGWLWWLAKPMFSVLDYIHSVLGNWGLSIIVLTIIIKAIFFKLSATSYRSMARMRKLAPKMKELKERYGDDRQKMSQETMKLYKEEKVNPLGGCLPMLIQMPVFLALYWVLMESVELRHTPFLWLADLSVKDPLFILPLLMGFTMWLTMRLNPEPPDPMQAKIMQFMPVVFTFMFLWFPAGLVLYWVTNNTLSFLQQMYITRQIEKENKAGA